MQSSTPAASPSLVRQFNRNFASLITTSLGVTAALSFNDAIKSMFDTGGMFEKVGSRGAWYTALFITVVAFLATFAFTHKYPDVDPPTRQNPIKI